MDDRSEVKIRLPRCKFRVSRNGKQKICNKKSIVCLVIETTKITLGSGIKEEHVREKFYACSDCGNSFLGSDRHDLTMPSLKRIMFL